MASSHGGKSVRPTATSDFHGASKIRPKKGSDKKLGSDGCECYPPTIDFATQSKEETASKIESGIKSRRPGGSARTSFATRGSDHLEHTKADKRSPNPTPGSGFANALKTNFESRFKSSPVGGLVSGLLNRGSKGYSSYGDNNND